MMRKPQRREMVLTGSLVLNPRKRTNDAMRVAVVKVT